MTNNCKSVKALLLKRRKSSICQGVSPTLGPNSKSLLQPYQTCCSIPASSCSAYKPTIKSFHTRETKTTHLRLSVGTSSWSPVTTLSPPTGVHQNCTPAKQNSSVCEEALSAHYRRHGNICQSFPSRGSTHKYISYLTLIIRKQTKVARETTKKRKTHPSFTGDVFDGLH